MTGYSVTAESRAWLVTGTGRHCQEDCDLNKRSEHRDFPLKTRGFVPSVAW